MFQWENTIVPMADRFFSTSAKEKSMGITDVRGIKKVVPSKNRQIRNIYSGKQKIYFQKYLKWIFRTKSLKLLPLENAISHKKV